MGRKKEKDVSVKLQPRARQKVEAGIKALQQHQGDLNNYVGGLRDALPGVEEDWVLNTQKWAFVPPKKKEA